ncbi:hypothetical protein ACER0C_009845 [Sarotherodon galilaeus]
METCNKNSIVVTPDQIMPPINRCFERLSEFQWSIIENGKCDSGIHAVLADMISEIIQITSASILNIALPVIQEPMIREAFMDEGKIRLSLGDSISAAIASALNVPKQQDKNADKLTLMVEEEISEKGWAMGTGGRGEGPRESSRETEEMMTSGDLNSRRAGGQAACLYPVFLLSPQPVAADGPAPP